MTNKTIQFLGNFTEENKRFSELLEISSMSKHLSTIRADLMALGHSCQMVSENAHMLQNETSTFLIDLQEVNTKLSEVQLEYRKTKKLAKKLYNDNKKLRLKVGKNKVQRKVLVKELKALVDEKRERKEFEEHILNVWDVHERMINLPKRLTVDTVNGNHSTTSPQASDLTELTTPMSELYELQEKRDDVSPSSSLRNKKLTSITPSSANFYLNRSKSFTCKTQT